MQEGLVPITATSTSTPTQVNTSGLEFASPDVTITGYDAGTGTADPITFPFAGPISYPSWVTAGVDGGTVDFSVGFDGGGFILTVPGWPVAPQAASLERAR